MITTLTSGLYLKLYIVFMSHCEWFLFCALIIFFSWIWFLLFVDFHNHYPFHYPLVITDVVIVIVIIIVMVMVIIFAMVIAIIAIVIVIIITIEIFNIINPVVVVIFIIIIIYNNYKAVRGRTLISGLEICNISSHV